MTTTPHARTRRSTRIVLLPLAMGALVLTACGDAGSPPGSPGQAGQPTSAPGQPTSAPGQPTSAPGQPTSSEGTPGGTSGPDATTGSSDTSTPGTATGTPRVDCSKVKCIALSFDDGPSENTDTIRKALQDKGARGTWFVIGSKVSGRASAVRRLAESGMEIGNHSWSHPDLTTLDAAGQASQVERGADAVEKVTGTRPALMRPPYGSFNEATRQLGVPVVNWDIDVLDWKTRSTSETTKRILKNAKPNAIVLMHDIQPSTARAMPAIVAGLQSQGYTLVTVGDIVGSPVAGKVYGTNVMGAGTPYAATPGS